jgi:succinyl-CoA synthetase beta subunit
LFSTADLFFRGATPETVKKAFEILLADPKVKSIFINIFGGKYSALSDRHSPHLQQASCVATTSLRV